MVKNKRNNGYTFIKWYWTAVWTKWQHQSKSSLRVVGRQMEKKSKNNTGNYTITLKVDYINQVIYMLVILNYL